MAQKMLAHLKGRPNELVIFVVFFSEGFVRVTSGKNNEDSFDTLCVEPTCFVPARAYQACFPSSLWFEAMADTPPRRQAGTGTNRPTRRRSVSRKRNVGETGTRCCTCNCKVEEDLGSKEELADAASESDGSDGDSDQELKHVLKTFGVIRVGGKWQRQEERASSTDSSGSSGESEGEDGDIDAKMDALRRGSQKVVILV